MTPQYTEDAVESPNFAALPTDVLSLLFSRLGIQDVLNAASTCTAWNRCLPSVWQARCAQRWRHWASAPPANTTDAVAWRDRYAHRHKVDAHILHLLADVACWQDRQAEAYSTILAYGADALDVLAAAAGSSRVSGMYLGIAHRAHTALLLVQGQLAAQRLQRMLAEQEGITAAAAPAVAAAGVAPCAGAVATPTEPAAGSTGRDDDVTAASNVTSPAGSACSNPQQEDDLVFEAALQVNLALHPLMNVSAVREAVAQLGQELSKRMEAAGAAPRSRKALELLNALLFNKPPAPAAQGSEGSQATLRGSQHSSIFSRCRCSGSAGSSRSDHMSTWSHVWPDNDDLYGADLSGFTVPTDGVSGLGLEADSEVYTRPYNGCLDTVLRYGVGLPIAMCVLHSAIGRRAGLDVELVNMPGRVINRARVVKATGTRSLSSSSGSSSCDEFTELVYVDVFNGVELDDELLRSLLSTLRNPWPLSDTPAGALQQLLPTMTPVSFCRRTVANLLNLYHSSCRARSLAVHSDPQPPLLSAPMVQLSRLFPGVLESIMHSMCSALGLSNQPNRATAQLFLQLFASCMDSPETASALQDALDEPEPQNGFLATITRALQGLPEQRGIEAFPVGTCVRTFGQSMGFVCDVHRGRQDDLVSNHVLTNHPEPVSYVISFKLDKVADNPACCPPGSAGCPDLSMFVARVQQAQRALQETWFEPEAEFQKAFGTGATSSSCVQQLLPQTSLESDVFAALRSCSKGLGHCFDAVLYDEDLQQWCLVPNACIRHKMQP